MLAAAGVQPPLTTVHPAMQPVWMVQPQAVWIAVQPQVCTVQAQGVAVQVHCSEQAAHPEATALQAWQIEAVQLAVQRAVQWQVSTLVQTPQAVCTTVQ